MASITKGALSVTETSQAFGPTSTGRIPDFVLINRGTNTVYLNHSSEAAVAEEGLNLETDERIVSKDLPPAWKMGRLTAVCASGESSTLYYHFG